MKTYFLHSDKHVFQSILEKPPCAINVSLTCKNKGSSVNFTYSVCVIAGLSPVQSYWDHRAQSSIPGTGC